MDAKRLKELGDDTFTKRESLLQLWQSIGENFYPIRADFTYQRQLGYDFASDLASSYPIIVCRELSDQIGMMLRPTEKQWFHMIAPDVNKEDNDARRWMEWATGVQRRAMYDTASQFARATKEGDADFATFGQFVMSVHLNRNQDTLLYRCWHLRDCAWIEGDEGKIACVWRKWKPKVLELNRLFGSKLHRNVTAKMERRPFEEVECMHIVVDSDLYDGDARGRPRWSVYYDCDNHYVIEATPIWGKHYIIPRWQTVAGSQYAFSPATIAALPDARLLQAMTMTLLEAGEKAVNPPLIATQDAVRSDIAIYAGGITWVDMEYDEKLGAALRPLTQDYRQLPVGIDMQRDSKLMLAQAFFLNKLALPQRAPEMTAFEIGQRVQEWIRSALPIFEPMEAEDNGQLCEETFDVLMRGGAFGSPFDMPRGLRGAEVKFKFSSPLHDIIEQQKGTKLLEAKALIAEAAALDRAALVMVDAQVALRDALAGAGVPAKWVRSEISVKQIERAKQQAEEAQTTLDAMEQGSVVAGNLASASKDLAAAPAM